MQVCTSFNSEKDVVVATVDATVNPALARRFSIRGFPIMKFIPKGAVVGVWSRAFCDFRILPCFAKEETIV